MSKCDFFKKLRGALRRSFNRKEIEDIITDYEGFYAEGAREGKDEGQICAEFDSPAVRGI